MMLISGTTTLFASIMRQPPCRLKLARDARGNGDAVRIDCSMYSSTSGSGYSVVEFLEDLGQRVGFILVGAIAVFSHVRQEQQVNVAALRRLHDVEDHLPDPADVVVGLASIRSRSFSFLTVILDDQQAVRYSIVSVPALPSFLGATCLVTGFSGTGLR
jgi:hypothetical protein